MIEIGPNLMSAIVDTSKIALVFCLMYFFYKIMKLAIENSNF